MKPSQLIQASLLSLLALAAVGARADVAAKWHTECSSCHIAYPPGMLPPASWKKLTSDLSHHFGADASLSAPDTQEIASFLEQNAAQRWPYQDAPLRITDSRWFKSRHGEIRAAVWQRASIKSQSNCSACHDAAGRGVFDEDTVRIPK